MAKAWLFQDPKLVHKHGARKTRWSVGWIDPAGRRRQKTFPFKAAAEAFRKRTELQLVDGSYHTEQHVAWAPFRQEYEARLISRRTVKTVEAVQIGLNHFERIVGPQRVDAIKTSHVDAYVAQRQTEQGIKPGSKVSPATINKELRFIRTILRFGLARKYVREMPIIELLAVPRKLLQPVTSDHFGLIYNACDVARKPVGLPFSPGDWWRALITFCYMTGWRVGEPLTLRRDDLDIEAGTAITRAGDNKGNRDDLAHLHPVVVEHLERIRCFHPTVFPWPHHRRTLWRVWAQIQRKAGINLPWSRRDEHECTEACHLYGFHDFRRAFASENALSMPAEALQRLMRHKSYQTTQGYIELARQLKSITAGLSVPDVLRDKATG